MDFFLHNYIMYNGLATIILHNFMRREERRKKGDDHLSQGSDAGTSGQRIQGLTSSHSKQD
jgi:hypothetical protein